MEVTGHSMVAQPGLRAPSSPEIPAPPCSSCLETLHWRAPVFFFLPWWWTSWPRQNSQRGWAWGVAPRPGCGLRGWCKTVPPSAQHWACQSLQEPQGRSSSFLPPWPPFLECPRFPKALHTVTPHVNALWPCLVKEPGGVLWVCPLPTSS